MGWEVLITPDEEIGSPSSAPLYQSAAGHHHLGLLFEPAFPDGAVASERKGSLSYTSAMRGRAAHVGRHFSEGISAVFTLARLIGDLEQGNQKKGLTVNVADVEAKGPLNVVPEWASCRINFRSAEKELLSEASHLLYQCVDHYQQTEGVLITLHQDSSRPPKPFTPATQTLFSAYATCASDLELPFHYRETGGVADGNLLTEAGLPNLDTAGVIGGHLHTMEEYFVLSSLVERARLAALFLFKLATKEIAALKGEIVWLINILSLPSRVSNKTIASKKACDSSWKPSKTINVN